MGMCLSSSVALWKQELYADGCGRRARGGDQAVAAATVTKKAGGGRDDYEILGGDDVLELEVAEHDEKVVAVPPRTSSVGSRRGVVEAAADVSGGTPSRPIWQRKVLMGVRCRMPRFSGMILYDESGRPVCGGVRDRAREQEKHAAAIAVLRGML